MSALSEPPLDAVFRRREHFDPINERRLASRVERGEIVRVGPGAFAAARAWDGLEPMDRHAQRVWEAASRLEAGTVLSHFAAAALHGADVLGDWPDRVDVSVDRKSGGRSTGRVRRHTRRLDELDVIPWGRHFVTSVVQTAIDLAAMLPFAEGVATADQVLWSRREGGPLATPDDLQRAADRFGGRGQARVQRVVAFASPQADSVRESQSRVIIEQLGFPRPRLQREFLLPSGRRAFTDFSWDEWDHVGEYDGLGKYLDPVLRRGRTPEQVLADEKDREDELRRVVRVVSRWRTRQLERPALLYDVLTRAGLPTTRPRPGF